MPNAARKAVRPPITTIHKKACEFRQGKTSAECRANALATATQERLPSTDQMSIPSTDQHCITL
eukprot:1369154-Pleurochrysis_carterae.AAC.1